MIQWIQWLNDNWLLIAVPVLIFLAFWVGGLWLRRIAYGAFGKWATKAKWKWSRPVTESTWTPFFYWFLLLGSHIAIRVSVLPSDGKVMAGKVIASLFVASLIWAAVSLSEKMLRLYLPELRLYLARIKAPQLPTTLLVNLIRAVIVVIGLLILLGIWGAPDVTGILILAAGLLVAGLALRDKLRQVRFSPLVRRVFKLLIILAVIASFIEAVRRGYLLFSHQADETSGTVILLLELGVLVWLIYTMRSSRFRRVKPSFKLVFFPLLVAAVVCAFAGFEPLTTYKNISLNYVKTQVGKGAEFIKEATPEREDVAGAVAKVEPAVVRVEVEDGGGSGMIIDKSGYVLTNNHVVEGVQSATVILMDGGQFSGVVVGRDELRDLAIIKISAGGFNFPVVKLGNSDTMGVAEEVIAIGYSLGLEGGATVSKGIISAFRRGDAVDYIQTDAALNPGSSGGPLIDLKGEVIGVVCAKVVHEAVEGVSFAIAINDAKAFIDEEREAEQAQKEIEKTQKDIEVLEREVVEIANSERASRSTAALTWDDELGRIAREHSQEMAKRGELFHSSMDKPYAENCWGGSPGSFYYFGASDIVSTWMESPKHRTWLLCPHLRHIGVGIAVSNGEMYASWTFWRSETSYSDWWYDDGSGSPPDWWY